jgi:hypothetical protein
MHVLASFELTEVANHFVHMAYDHFNDPPPPEKSFSGYAHDVASKLIFYPNQPINHSEVQMHLWVS